MKLGTIVCAFHGLFLDFHFDLLDLFTGQRTVVGDRVRVQFVRWHQVADQVGLIDHLVVMRLYSVATECARLPFNTKTSHCAPLHTEDTATLSIYR